ncbi:5-formyltetrahydrofolate cyclo-ligase [Heyndrickxia ginsengihumi]|uniref:5-formyltetrahydrofolate cyclo-ligase n=1 Tax=Heyndrickxia ginsengihumi TaxID=363870 RepID=A0A0A6VE81_9BACI|nr:5-formyltetrahydrofolate cyclo-ligase [Heyndrickxia ginsengihumi]KHD84839.1 hypothetical protein NG54_12915 [Heyndrickxia ginsengihumi]MBE6183774.1 5-formyltetrahydrofolate cyclo-ligase [Bacillus sp. (in: firmicutes)]MCM3022765.1 5-formyltetrahydrofolate cyclo-ligase [Heyndrickxia ginsengihumi]NEY20033.1 5-formyltetrahydrofolate cyclo-ligase [Heyndrickxia ginsengihumi]
MDKKTLRTQLKAKLATIDRPKYEQKSLHIATKLYSLPEWKEAEKIAITISNVPEVDTWQIIRKAWEQQKKVCVPKCLSDQKQLEFYELRAFTDLEKGFYGLYEPIKEAKKVSKDSIDIIIVPGLAFTYEGYRLGFGGGYYDRFLANFTKKTISLAFKEQLIDSLPIETFDIPVRTIVTEDQIIYV